MPDDDDKHVIEFDEFRAAVESAARSFAPYAEHFGTPIKHCTWSALVWGLLPEWLPIPAETPALMPNGYAPSDRVYVALCDGQRVTGMAVCDFSQDTAEGAARLTVDALRRTIEDPDLASYEGCEVCGFKGRD